MHVLIIGGGGLGQALAQHYVEHGASVQLLSRRQPMCSAAEWFTLPDYSSESLQQVRARLHLPNIVVCTLGVLHSEDFMPEKRLADINMAQLQQTFHVNATLPMLLLQQLLPLLPSKAPCVWAQLSAKVGSISDNYLGGWYSYRASKAALNMLLKTASVELRRTHKQLCLAAIHPGTTDTDLSKPFQQRLPANKLYTPALSAQRIAQVIENLTAENTGGFWHWDGSPLGY